MNLDNSPPPSAGALAPVVVVSFNRPQFLEPVLRSLKGQRPRDRMNREIHLFQDGAVNRYSRIRYAGDVDIDGSIDLFRRLFPEGTVHASPDNIGICENFRRAERYVFEERGFACAYFLEDDLVLSPAYLNMMDRIRTWARASRRRVFRSLWRLLRECGRDWTSPPRVDHPGPSLGFRLVRPALAGDAAGARGFLRRRRGNRLQSAGPPRDLFALCEARRRARATSQDAAKALACDRLGFWRCNAKAPFAICG